MSHQRRLFEHNRVCALSRESKTPLNQRCFSSLALVLLSVCVLQGCASLSKSRASAKSERSGAKLSADKVRSLQQELAQTRRKLEDLKERNLILENQRVAARPLSPAQGEEKSIPIPFHPSANPDSKEPRALASSRILTPEPERAIERNASLGSRAPSVRALSTIGLQAPHAIGAHAPQAKIPTVLPKKASPAPAAKPIESVGAAQTGEHFLYSKILETYRKKNMAEMEQSLRLLLKTYPDSVFADNSMYLAGLLAFEREDLSLAHTYMARVIRDFPRGNKTVSAYFAKAGIERKQSRFEEARNTLKKLRALYPGSPEAERVSVELKIIDLQAAKRRES